MRTMSASGGAGVQKHCRLFSWIEQQDKQFAEVVRDLCLEDLLSPGPAGVTLLWPAPDYRQQITDAALGPAPEGAVAMIESLVAPVLLQSAAEFAGKGTCRAMFGEVKAEGNDRALLADGVVLQRDTKFSALGGRGLAVWHVTAGRLPTSGTPYTPPVAKMGGGAARRPRRGGAESAVALRAEVARATERQFAECMAKDRCRAFNPYLARVLDLLNHLKAHAPDAFARVAPILDFDPVVCFYLLLEPYAPAGPRLLSDVELASPNSAWTSAGVFTDAVAEYKELFGEMKNAAGVAARVGDARAAVLDKNVRGVIAASQAQYSALAGNNSIGGLQGVLPAATLAALPGLKKMGQDEFRYWLHGRLAAVRAGPFEPAKFAELVLQLSSTHRDPGACIITAELVNCSVAPRAELMCFCCFVRSTAFLYTAKPPAGVGAPEGSMSNPSDPAVFNYHASALRALDESAGMKQGGGLGPDVLGGVQAWIRKGGDPMTLATLPL